MRRQKLNTSIYAKHPWKTEDVVWAYEKYLRRSKLFVKLRFAYFLVGVSFLSFALYRISVKQDLPALIFIILGMYFLLIYRIRLYFFSRNFQRLGYENRQVEWEINEDEIICRMLNLSETIFSWNLVNFILETSKGFIFSTQQGMFCWLPKYAFKNEEDITQFAYLAKDKVKNWQRIK